MRTFPQFVKVAWMFFWRLVLLQNIFMQQINSWPLILSILVAAGLVFALRKTIRTFPLVRLFLRRPVIQDLEGAIGTAPQGAPGGHVSQSIAHSKFLPRDLASTPVPKLPNMFGSPGLNLATGTGLSARNASLGQTGEENFAKGLYREGLLQRTSSFWSLSMPASHHLTPDPTLRTDIDCVLAYDDTLLLLDLKYYSGGDLTYRQSGDQLFKYENSTGMPYGKPTKMSKNMAIAYERFSRLLPQYSVYAMVVFVPTDKGPSTLDNVVWPGNIPAVNMDEMADYLNTVVPTNTHNDGALRKRLYPLTVH